jgi:hypothetical protein
MRFLWEMMHLPLVIVKVATAQFSQKLTHVVLKMTDSITHHTMKT